MIEQDTALTLDDWLAYTYTCRGF